MVVSVGPWFLGGGEMEGSRYLDFRAVVGISSFFLVLRVSLVQRSSFIR